MNKKILGLMIVFLVIMTSSIIAISSTNNLNSSTKLSFAEVEKPLLSQQLIYYKFPMLSDSCDLHWLRMQVYYYCGMLPNGITKADPELYIGFAEKLNETQEQCLNLSMNNNLCVEPEGIKCKIYTDITPQALESNTIDSIGKKPMYYSNGTRVWIILFDDLNITSQANIQEMFKDMWTIECK